MRRVGAVRAAIAAILSDGLGYLYVGRPLWALALWLARTALICLIGWTRLIVGAGGFYFLVATGTLLVVVVPLHAAWFARQHPLQPRLRWNRAWVYFLWLVATWGANAVLSTHRGEWLGFESFRVASISMTPTLEPNDFVIANTWRFRDQTPQVGDIVAFHLPSEQNIYLKRVIGLPGDHVAVTSGRASRNGAQLEEPYLHAPLDEPYSQRDFKYVPALAPDEYFVLGDLRDNSKDSRNWGPIRREWIVGRVEYRWLSLDGWHLRRERFPVSVVPAPR